VSQPWEFEEPVAQGDRFTAEDAKNRRLIVVPTEYVPQVRTSRGDVVDAIRINVVDLDNQGGPATYWGALWFGNKLIGTFKPKPGKLFLGYLSKQQTGGGFQAWVFTSLTQDPQTTTMAGQFLQGNPEFMETCQGDVAMAERNAQATPTQQPQGQGQWQQQGQAPWPQVPQPGLQQPPWPATQSQPPPWQREAPPASPPPPINPPLPPVQAPPVPGPAPLPPPAATDQWPSSEGTALRHPVGNGQASAPPAQTPGSPAPVGGSVMDRLRAQRDQEAPVIQDTGNLPF